MTNLRLRESDGVLNVPLALLLSTAFFSIFCWIFLLQFWERQVATQLRLDRCVAQVARKMKKTGQNVESMNREIRVLRASAAVATLAPQARIELQAAIAAVSLAQEVLLQSWTLEKMQWISRQACKNIKDSPTPMPSFPWSRLPPDDLGPLPLQWNGGPTGHFFIQSASRNRYAAAWVEGRPNELQNEWKAKWAVPRRSATAGLFGTGPL